MNTKELIKVMLDKIDDENLLSKIYKYICYWYSRNQKKK